MYSTSGLYKNSHTPNYLFLYKIAVFQFKQGKFIKQYVNKPMGKKNLNRLFNQKSKHNYKLSILRIGY